MRRVVKLPSMEIMMTGGPGTMPQWSRWKGDTSMVQCLRELKKKMSQGTATGRGGVCHRYDTSRRI